MSAISYRRKLRREMNNRSSWLAVIPRDILGIINYYLPHPLEQFQGSYMETQTFGSAATMQHVLARREDFLALREGNRLVVRDLTGRLYWTHRMDHSWSQVKFTRRHLVYYHRKWIYYVKLNFCSYTKRRCDMKALLGRTVHTAQVVISKDSLVCLSDTSFFQAYLEHDHFGIDDRLVNWCYITPKQDRYTYQILGQVPTNSFLFLNIDYAVAVSLRQVNGLLSIWVYDRQTGLANRFMPRITCQANFHVFPFKLVGHQLLLNFWLDPTVTYFDVKTGEVTHKVSVSSTKAGLTHLYRAQETYRLMLVMYQDIAPVTQCEVYA